jgi:hypothetical protein
MIGYETTRILIHFESDRGLKPAWRNFTQLVLSEFRSMGISFSRTAGRERDRAS